MKPFQNVYGCRGFHAKRLSTCLCKIYHITPSIFLYLWHTNKNYINTNHINIPESKFHVANMGPALVLSAPSGPHVGPMSFAIRDTTRLISREIYKLVSLLTQSQPDKFIYMYIYIHIYGYIISIANTFTISWIIWHRPIVVSQINFNLTSASLQLLYLVKMFTILIFISSGYGLFDLRWFSQLLFLRNIIFISLRIITVTYNYWFPFCITFKWKHPGKHLQYNDKTETWASCQIPRIAGCACAGNVFPTTEFKWNRQLAIPACITARASRTCHDACRDHQPTVVGKTFPAFPAHAQPAILHIWQEAHWACFSVKQSPLIAGTEVEIGMYIHTFDDISEKTMVCIHESYLTDCAANAKHDDVIKWKHFPHYWPFMRGIHRSPMNSPHKGHWCGALMFSLICF